VPYDLHTLAVTACVFSSRWFRAQDTRDTERWHVTEESAIAEDFYLHL
jgi:hypothetical protein